MKKRSRFFVANIVLGCIFGIFLIFSVMLTYIFDAALDELEAEELANIADYPVEIPEREGGDSYWDDYDWEYYGWSEGEEDDQDGYEDEDGYHDSNVYTLLSLESIWVEPLGAEYQGISAEEGYQYYALNMMVHNAGTDYALSKFLNMYCEGANYSDVYMEYDYDPESPLQYTNMEVIPAGMTGAARVILQVKNGVESVDLYFYNSYEDEEYEIFTIPLN